MLAPPPGLWQYRARTIPYHLGPSQVPQDALENAQ